MIKNFVNRTCIAIPLIIIGIASYLYPKIYNLGCYSLSIILIYEYIINIFKYSKKNVKNKNNIDMLLIGFIWIIPFIYTLFFKINRKNFIYILLLNAISDTLQYLIGSKYGKIYKNNPFRSISPNKTIIGYIFGLSLAFIISILIFPFTSIQIIILLIFGVFGDLFASIIKRKLEIKDFSNLLNTHGGFLDRFDSSIFSIVIFSNLFHQ